ncbi:MAG TPA: cadmium-translocating P-type ATPase [Armatimonadetes bacterium]|nr:cadmium-translocating P-type ATPase [Armatimonadota bacterium]
MPQGKESTSEGSQSFWQRRPRELLLGLSTALLVAAWGWSRHAGPGSLVQGLFLTAILLGGAPMAGEGLRALKGRRVGIDFLMTLGVIGAVILGEWGEAAAVVILFAVAELLEKYSVERTRGAIKALMDLTPPTALVQEKGGYRPVLVKEVPVGARVLVKPGTRVPVDGTVVEGASTLDESSLTGEAQPVEKKVGDVVYAGTMNQQGSLIVEATKRAEETLFAQIVRYVEKAQAQRAPVQRFVDRFAARYTPAVISLALLVAFLPPLFGLPLREWMYRGLVLLVISCPCALVLSTPVAIVSALTAAARQGVLIKGGKYLETAGVVRAVAFDKTGTLTTGRLAVSTLVPFNHWEPQRLLTLAAAVEQHSEHPIAAAVVSRARAEGLTLPPLRDFVALPGRGAQARIDGQTVSVGSPRWFEEQGLLGEGIRQRIRQVASAGHTPLLVGGEGEVWGLLTVADEPRAESASVVQALKRLQVARVVMLTGDDPATAEAVAEKIGVDLTQAALLPTDKVDAVQALQREYAPVLMVGDGVNDAPALAAADVGVAMGAAGTDVALETADVALMADDLTKLPFLLTLSRRTRRLIRQNIVFALVMKFIFLLLTVPGVTTLWMAVGADVGASLLVIFNALRLQSRR